MAHHIVHQLACFILLLAVTSSHKEQTRWSRQISSYTSDISDWVPLNGPVQREPPQSRPPATPIKRQAVAEPRILTEPFPGFARPNGFTQEAFPSRTYFNSPANRQLYLQSVPSAPQNYLTDQGFGQGIRFGLSQPNFPLNQGFVAPQLSFENSPPARAPPKQQLPPSQVQFPKPPPPIQQSKPFINQVPKPTVETTKFVDGYRLENQSNSNFGFNSQKKAQSLQKLKLEAPKTEQIAAKTNPEREEVQLLYVPLESLNRGQFNFRSPVSSPQIINSDLYSLPKLDPLQQTFAADYQRPVAKPIDTFMSSKDYITNYDLFKNFDQVPKFSTVTSPFPTSPPTTPKPKKLKPHQPPLAIFQETKKNANIKVGDVLASLKNANTIAVLDSVNPLNAPKVFIGPSSLIPPENFVKFELPYLSNIENSDKKLRQLPFFVAPLSYNTPNGFAKIPFPSPHVGSVVINSLIKDTPSTIYPTSKFQTTPQHHTTPTVLSTPTAKIIPNSYTVAPPHKHERKPDISLNQNYNYYSTGAPKTNAPSKPATQSTYYSLEPQTITALPPSREATSNIGKKQNTGYFLSNVGDQYNSPQFVKFPSQNDDKKQDRTRYYTPVPKSETTTLKTTTTAATTKLSTHSSQLLETHNPYSINQAFHFSTPLDYHSYFDEFKESYAPPPGVNLELPKSSEDPISSTPRQIITTKSEEIVTQKSTQQTSPNYIQNYTPEIHYESEIQNIRYPVYSSDFTTKTGSTSEPHRTTNSANIDITQQINQNSQSHYSENGNIQGYENITETIVNKVTGPAADIDNHGYENSKYENGYESEEIARPNPTTSSTSTTTTTTTSTRRSPIRTRGRPRYTTTPRTESSESITKSTVTRRPLRERRPLPPRSRYEPNKISNDKTTRKPTDSNESTTKSSRTRSRGRIQYKPSGNDEIYEKKNKLQNSKETDLAYQRDILHQNYPVTLMERTSTVDIEAITEPSPKTYYTKTLESGPDIYDTENAYAHQSPAVSQLDEISYKDDVPNYTSRSESSLEYQQSRNSLAPVQQIASHEDSFEKQQEISSHIIPDQKVEKPELIAYPTESSFSVSTGQPEYSVNHDESSAKQEDTTTSQDIEITKLGSQETTTENEPEENIVQTTPSYNRVRIRPGVIKQYHQASSTESTRSKSERRKPVHAITYRPAFDRRRTTMRIEEIEADLKTKQVHARPEVQDHRHPVYKPDTSTETSASSSTQESFIKRGQFRRRRPSYSTTSTEATSTKKIYEVKNRFRGRRPTEKPTEKPDSQTESSPATVRNTYSSRYSHRPRLSERYNKKPENEPEETEDQDSNYSITRPKYVAPETEQWSPKISSESFKPYNPNDILDEGKLATTERRSDKLQDNIELDIITARNDYDDILISVTPATNNRLNKKIPDIPPTLEALVEQSKTTKSESGDNMSTFETMLEEVMKSLEEQDEDEYTSKVTKHKGGEIGEIPPERIIDSGEDIATKQVTAVEGEIATAKPTNDENISAGVKQDQVKSKNRRRGFWKKVKVRPSTESIEVAESQYYSNTVNRLGQSVKLSNAVHEKPNMYEKPKYSVTTYKPSFQFIKDIFSSNEENLSEADALSYVDIPKVNKEVPELDEEIADESKITEIYTTKKTTTVKPTSVGDEDLGTGTPDPTIMDNMYISTPTEPTVSESVLGILDKSEDFSFMDYLFGTTSSDTNKKIRNETAKDVTNVTKPKENVEITTEQTKAKISTTETSYIPDEITTEMLEEDNVDHTFEDIKKISNDKDTKDVETTTQQVKTETSTVSSFMNPANILSTSMSTEISHETEICFRGKCIKTSKDIL
ncbi:mucin-5AC [Galleria mellonella]|uniref:Mucin-5AC n=1 Tax=Galleria mellonella TaxID=7137 RepID=A0ABM3N371_GALME|nr:mucin-5AC [Galleria mellonella]